MPLYAYKCEACGYQFDKFQHFVDDPLTVCPSCQMEALRKVYSPVGIVFKGKGFYATDNRSPSGMTSSKSAAETAPSPESTPTKTAENPAPVPAANASKKSTD